MNDRPPACATRRAFLGLSALLGFGCGSRPELEALDARGLRERLRQAFGAPLMMFVWAPWSRRSVALLPSFLELTGEYASAGVSFFALCLSAEPNTAARLIPGGAGEVRSLLWPGDLESLGDMLGPVQPPAALVYDGGGVLRLSLDDSDPLNPLDPDALAAAIEAAAAEVW